MSSFRTSPQAFTLWWVSDDKQSCLPMGEFASREAAEAGIPAARAEMLDQGGDGSGSFSVDAPREADE